MHSFCWILVVTGCRISEALSLSERSIDFETQSVVIECLKKRRKQVFRTVPLSPELLALLRKMLANGVSPGDRLWPWSRMTGYRRVLEVMGAAGVVGPHATPKGLRHAFGVCAIQSDVPLNLIQRWLGHADIKTTAIYANAIGPEEREFASRTWSPGAGRSGKRRSSSAKRSALMPGASRTATQIPEVGVGGLVHETRPPRLEDPDSGVSSSLLKLGILLNYRVSGVVKAFPCMDEPERDLELA